MDEADARLLRAWGPAARELDVEVRGPGRHLLPDGRDFEAELLFPDFGNLRGTAVVSDPERLAELEPILAGTGYRVALLPAAATHVRPAFELAQILRSWGWSGSEKGRPEFM